MPALTKHLVWTPAIAEEAEHVRSRSTKSRGVKAGVPASAQPSESLALDIALPPREQAIYLLHIGAEVEHALMAQYLYGARHCRMESRMQQFSLTLINFNVM